MHSSTPGLSPQVGTALAGSSNDPGLTPLESAPEPGPQPTIRPPEPAAILIRPSLKNAESTVSSLPLSLLRHLLRQITELKLSTLSDLVPALRIVAIALAAGLVVRITGAVLGSLNDLPLLGGLLELVGLIKLIQLISRHALRQQKRAELLARIQELKRRLLG